MVRLKKIEPLSSGYLESIGFKWHTDSDGSPYVADELVVLSEDEANAYYEAANELYDMYVEAAQYVIENNLFHELNIPFNLADIIKKSWENDVHWHIYSRFDFAGGIDDKPIKLLEFNSDTPTALFETAILQWAMLKYNGLNEAKQFNNVYEAIKDNFKRTVTLHKDISNFDKWYEGWKILFSSIKGSIEDENTTKLLQIMASEAGFETDFCYADEVGFSDEGIFCNEKNFEFWFKLIPWEDIAIEEPQLAAILTNIVKNQKAIIFNPPYTLLFQSKGMMKILWDLFPDHPLLLKTSFEPIEGKKFVEKRCFGREGENVVIYDENGDLIEKKDGEYGNFKPIYQEFIELPKDERGRVYQAGVFFAYEGCGVGFRRGELIIDNMSKFVGHIIE
ncbi:glutathionylspermidine synthase family protein [Nitrosophilus labii]|uniref:glutathionylspermidine synthase family protein n=1 Tax=Nitrosophilus labii TaxID=2706014 RepID=UPI0016573630|nr:glutathionylspermidine synthase family protein [Nitrosophilus labii]